MPLEVQFNKDRSLDDIKVVEVQKPSISNEGQVLIKFLLNPINPSDILSIKGLYNGFQPDSYPAVPGVIKEILSTIFY
jgi:NADPH:quinone reductase-like Zn-dependent oxidoreductase